MVSPTVGSVVLVQFPFSGLSRSKLRPALVLADAKRGDWILCQITSNPYADNRAVNIAESDFETGSLRISSYARPGKLFTANQSLMTTYIGNLNKTALRIVIETVVEILRP